MALARVAGKVPLLARVTIDDGYAIIESLSLGSRYTFRLKVRRSAELFLALSHRQWVFIVMSPS